MITIIIIIIKNSIQSKISSTVCALNVHFQGLLESYTHSTVTKCLMF